MKLAEIKQWLDNVTYEEWPHVHEQLSTDARVGVQRLLAAKERAFARERDMRLDFEERSAFEREFREAGHTAIAGVDEVGRGPLAGPVVAAAVILPEGFYHPGLTDSKKMSKAKREAAYEHICEVAKIGVGVIDAPIIDEINIYEATKRAMGAAITQLGQVDALLIDAMKLDMDVPQQSLIKGDARSVSIAAASVIAKVTRDRMMDAYDVDYPGYGFSRNSGYGTAEHLEGLSRLGVTPIHRRSFEPVKQRLT